MSDKWTEHEELKLKEGILRGKTTREIAEELGRSYRSVRHRYTKLNQELGDTPEPNDVESALTALRADNAALRSRVKKLELNTHASEQMVLAVQELLRPLPAPKPLKIERGGTTKETLVIHISDMHGDQIVPAHRVQGFEDYNFNEVCIRAEHYINTITKFALETLSNYHFEDVVILIYGDMINGEIHGAAKHSTYREAIRNALAVGQLVGLMVRDISAAFNVPCSVLSVSGNHGRRSTVKDYRGARDNWDYLVAKVAEQLTSDDPLITWTIPDSYTCNITVRDWIFNVSHGDDVRSWMGIPWYGIERRTRRLACLTARQGQTPDYYVMGHFHTLSSQQTPTGEIFINGSWAATDEYCFNALAVASEPMQLIHGVHDEHGVTWRLPIHLRSSDAPKSPARYLVDIGD